MPLEHVDTPALIVDLEVFEANLEAMAAFGERAGIFLRPHAKTHKCAVIAMRQVARGAIGVCTQKVSEAEAMVMGGVSDVYVSNEIVGTRKLEHLAALARQARMSLCVDHPDQIAAASAAAVKYKTELGVRVEINTGGNRCGVEPGQPAVDLAQRIARSPGLRFEGLQAYFGRAQHIEDHGERRAAALAGIEKAKATQAALAASKLACTYIGGAGTGTYEWEGESGVYNELQVGSYLFMDVAYGKNRDAQDNPVSDYRQSLFVYSTVMSRPQPNRAVFDAGVKAVSLDAGPPRLWGEDDVEYVRGGDEHCSFVYKNPNRTPALGDKLMLVPGHCDPTVNFYDWYVGVREGRVEALWPITARGALL
ncbi:MAG: DSD1 family PLP-dependent enzyme [Proteobacteria bacterium]|nr:DSD1 family PLP-dependent enzyme [Pseudomonadota bacterium]MBI3498117.1 DSD1 family PLP-dependent enzyme [Pseudomonadota bacterium]